MFKFIKNLFGTVDDGAGIWENQKFKSMESRRDFMKNASAGIVTAPLIVSSLIAESQKTGKPIDIIKAKKMIESAKVDESLSLEFNTQCYTLTPDERIKYGRGHDERSWNCHEDINDALIYYAHDRDSVKKIMKTDGK